MRHSDWTRFRDAPVEKLATRHLQSTALAAQNEPVTCVPHKINFVLQGLC